MNISRNIFPAGRVAITTLLMSISLSIIMPVKLLAQDDIFTPSKELSLQLFANGEFEEALKHFEALLRKYPADPLYKYYSGACKIETGKNIEEATELLKGANGSSSSLRSVPPDAWYYLGRAYHLSGDFKEAINCYDRFREKVRKKELIEYNIDTLIDQCTSGEGSLIEEPVSINKPANSEVKTDSVEIDTNIDQEVTIDSITQLDNLADVKVSVEDTPADYDMIAGQALEFQFQADSLSRLANRYRLTVKALTGQDRETISKKILELETLTFEYQSLADKKLAEAARFNRILYDGEDETELKEEAVPDLTEEANNDVLLNKDTSGIAEEEIDSVIVRDPVLTIFDPDCKQPEEISVNDPLPEGMFYRIQTAAFRNPVKPSHFKTLGPVYGIKADGSDITFYSIGFFRKKADADRAVNKVRAAGFKDAFVVAQLEGARISLERSLLLEKEWGEISLVDPALVVKEKKSSVPETLVFRVQVRSSEEELPEDDLETLRLVAGNRDFDIIKNDDEEYVYLIGKFLTFESALSYSDLLYRNGMKEARVAAYLGVKEIPVEKARELFDLNYNK